LIRIKRFLKACHRSINALLAHIDAMKSAIIDSHKISCDTKLRTVLQSPGHRPAMTCRRKSSSQNFFHL
jgi:hypothetical protein